ncbi:hypothetical protein BV25DRAFT_1919692 [Artomyces pyxidatus]|uniref:Uncharacterized protein n=1 Tax=Artomyces pyxidatus TaxID=48021 RepID=A0ACB8SPW1_9AGAM|nr:hypothetical protein BV25DRAFT_1919692 [Artomyces pyxidatus]
MLFDSLPTDSLSPDDFLHRSIRPPQPIPLSQIMPIGHPRNSLQNSTEPLDAAANRSYIPQLIPPGVDPAKVDGKMFYSYVPNTIKTRKRTSPAQLKRLEGIFVDDKKPNGPLRTRLADELGMSPREVQVWFQNRRAKEKKGSTARPEPSTSSTPDGHVESASEPTSPAPSSIAADSPVKPEPGTPEPSPAPQSTSWAPDPLPTVNHPAHPSPPDASPAAYELRRSSLPVLSLIPPPAPPPFPTPLLPASVRQHRHSVDELALHPGTELSRLHPHPAVPDFARRASGPVRASLSEGTRFQPFPRPNLAHRASVPYARPPIPSSAALNLPGPGFAFPEQRPVPSQSQSPDFSWHNPDPFGQGVLPETGYSFGLPAPDAVAPDGAYEFPARKGSDRGWDGMGAEMAMAYRRSIGSVASIGYSDTSTSAGTGPYFSDITSEDGDGRRGSCTSTSERFSGLRVDEYSRSDGPGSDYAASEHGTATYPSPTSTLDDRERPTPPSHSSSSELALALHTGDTHDSDVNGDQQYAAHCSPPMEQQQHYAPPDAPPPSASFKFSDAEQHAHSMTHAAYAEYVPPPSQPQPQPYEVPGFSSEMYAQQHYSPYATGYVDNGGGNSGEQYAADGYGMPMRYHHPG